MFDLLDNSIAWAHLQLRGGWRNVAVTTGAYILLIVAMIFLTLRLARGGPTQILDGWAFGLVWLESAFLLLLGCGGVSTAIRNDLASGMIESHRLMPVSAGAAIAGYLVGPTLQTVALAGATFLIGLGATMGSGASLTQWVMPSFLIATFSLFLWVTVAVTAFVHRALPRVIFGAAVLLLISQGVVLTLVPGVSLLISPMLGRTVFNFAWRLGTLEWYHHASLAAQAYFATIFFVGAMRKYRRGDALALPPLLGVLLLIGWVAVGYIGIANWDELHPLALSRVGPGMEAQFLVTFILTMIVALLPVLNAAKAQARAARLAREGPALLDTMPLLLAVALATAASLVLCGVAPYARAGVGDAVARTGVAVFAHLLACGYVARILLAGGGKRVNLMVGVWIGVASLVPILADFVRHSVFDRDTADVFGVLFTCSPMGVIIAIWGDAAIETTAGLVVQVVIALVPVVLYHAGRRARPAAPTAVAAG